MPIEPNATNYDERYDMYKDSMTDHSKEVAKNIPKAFIWYMLIIGLGLWFAVVIAKIWTWEQIKTYLIPAIILGIYLAWQKKSEAEGRSLREAKAILLEEIRWEQRQPESAFPDGDPKFLAGAVPHRFEGRMQEYEIGFIIKELNGLIHKYTGLVSYPREHGVLGVREQLFGFTGREAKDVVVHVPFRFRQEEMFRRTGGYGGYR